MRITKPFYITIIALLLICTACNIQRNRPTISTSGSISTITVTKLTSSTSTPTQISTRPPVIVVTASTSPSSTLTPVPTQTPIPIDPQVTDLLNLNEENYCSKIYTYQCLTIINVKILEYLYQHPESPQRQQLLNKMVSFWSGATPQWIIEDWLTQTIVPQIVGKSVTSEEFGDFEEKWGQIFVTDLDDNGDPDYVITLRLHNMVCIYLGQMYWIYRTYQTDETYQVKLLPTTVDSDETSMYPTVLSTDDLTGDGLPELTYVSANCGPSDLFQKPRILSWQNGQFVDRLADRWHLINGDLSIKEKNEEGVAGLLITQGQTGYGGFAPYSPYQVDLELKGDEYIPVKQTLLYQPDIQQRDGDILYWQWANFVLHQNRYAEAVDAFNVVAKQPASFFGWVDYRPYALFRMGVTYIVLDDQTAAQRSWEQLITEFPNHPISLDVMTLKNILQNRNDLGKVCVWLQENGGRWWQPQWAASESAVVFTKWQLYQYEEQKYEEQSFKELSQKDYEEWLAAQEPFDYDQARETLEAISSPQDYNRRLTGWEDLCNPIFLTSLYTWKQEAAHNQAFLLNL